jgi:hypothetical protein
VGEKRISEIKLSVMETVPGPTHFQWRQGLVIAFMHAGFSQKETALVIDLDEKTIRGMTQERGLQWVAHHGRRGPLPEIPEEVKAFMAYVARIIAELPRKRPPDTPRILSAPAPSSPNLSSTSLLHPNGDTPLHFEI